MNSKNLCTAIETSSRTSGVAIFNGERFTELNRDAQLTHSETLQPQLEEVLRLSKTPRGAIDLIAVSIGPGSFTGLRIGLAAAKALAYAWNVPIIGVPTLTALAYHFPFDRVLTMTDAQKNRAYCQMFDRLTPLDEIKIKPIDEAISEVGLLEGEIIICGDAVDKIKCELPSNVRFAPPNLRMPRAVNVGLCALEMFARGKVDNVMNLEPLYIRRSEAEELWERRHPN